MFDKVTKKLTEKMGRTVKEAAQPIHTAVTQAANDKMDLYSKILKFGMLVLLFIGGTKQLTNESKKESGPSQITIKNYLCEKPERKVND
jgi:hypothetical protein